MFRMLELKPPHGWKAVAWELVIVTVGVLMALAFQQWAESVGSASRTARAREAIRQELGDHYLNAIEWRAFSPCVASQIDRIEDRIARSKSVLRPIEVRHLDKIALAIMAPRRIYDDSAWKGSISDGTALQLTDRERKQLTNEYWLAGQMSEIGDRFVDGDERLLSATRPLELDPQVKHSLFDSIDRIRAANDLMDNTAAQIIYWVELFGRAPSRAAVQSDSERNSAVMRDFCSRQRLPVRPLSIALDPNS